ncbi:MAG: hypothetical protein AB8G14_14340 [Ilumatobacter sp.]
MTTTTRRCVAALATTALFATACGGGSDDADAQSADPAGDAAEGVTETASDGDADTDDADINAVDADEDTPAEQADDEAGAESDPAPDQAGTFEPGPVQFRTVNLSDAPVDIWAVTNGVREAFPLASSVAPGAITEFVAPPLDGRYLLTVEGEQDPTCVIDCVGHISELFSFAEEGPSRTVLVYDDEQGNTTTFEAWELPTAERSTSSNSMPVADAGTTLVSVTAVAVADPPFGMRLAVEGTQGCLPNLTGDSRLIGGNQVLTFDIGFTGGFTLHDFEDDECAEAAIAGPFTVDPAPGARVHALLTGNGTDVDAVLLPMVDGLADGATSSQGDRALALEQMTTEVATEFGLDETQAACAAELLVDRIGSDLLLDDTGTLVDLDSFDDAVNELAGAALFDSVDTCGIDPAVFGG